MYKQKKMQPEPPDARPSGTVHCRSCGAVFSSELPECPYCGTMNLHAAEKTYMDRLEHVRSGLEDLGSDPGRNVKTHLRSLRKRLIIEAAILIIAVLAGFTVHSVRERRDAEKERAEAVWQVDYFRQMDAAYAAGDYALLDELYCSAMEDHNIWMYKHWHFCDCYRSIRQAEDALQAYEDGQCMEADLLYFDLRTLELEDKEEYVTPEEYALLLSLRAPVLDDLTQRFGMTEEDLAAFRSAMRTDGYLKFELCDNYLKERGNQP